MRPPVARKLRTPALDSPIGPRVRYRLLWLPLLYTQAEYHCYRFETPSLKIMTASQRKAPDLHQA
ncbi:hypothetical protein T4B_11804 [Trichinella pseudospiralis]|uniref:Uncharacterized protein n=1 Tax=Trichinella pseudospiralis TaxID=6337 RepID=A0A0V1IHS8_TRIPS|nr:hypothetical protein T4E_1324 [Trichinella pseudospiralis]KRY64723.1 hypothetical protein T4A_13830 [Trichinella pseudospiralis]KRY64730.1 hypothetical protein T4A_1406 [Trichinella pseudospiralis]KRY64913.1 hypothetical protein T4A_1569 [Trichinella pseudospiralis]KRZ22116.1 hypothetical protein T4B_11804 [Trichinella pseudospiralis]